MKSNPTTKPTAIDTMRVIVIVAAFEESPPLVKAIHVIIAPM